LIQIGLGDSENLIKRLEISSNQVTLLWYNVQQYSVSANWSSRKASICNCAQSPWLGKHFAEKCFCGPEKKDIQQKDIFLLVGLSHRKIF
jgi:hypothetical protein